MLVVLFFLVMALLVRSDALRRGSSPVLANLWALGCFSHHPFLLLYLGARCFRRGDLPF